MKNKINFKKYILLVPFVMILFFVNIESVFAQVSSTPISTCAQLQGINQSKAYHLTNDINCNWVNFYPIVLGSPYTGGAAGGDFVLDGKGYKIFNLKINTWNGYTYNSTIQRALIAKIYDANSITIKNINIVSSINSDTDWSTRNEIGYGGVLVGSITADTFIEISNNKIDISNSSYPGMISSGLAGFIHAGGDIDIRNNIININKITQKYSLYHDPSGLVNGVVAEGDLNIANNQINVDLLGYNGACQLYRGPRGFFDYADCGEGKTLNFIDNKIKIGTIKGDGDDDYALIVGDIADGLFSYSYLKKINITNNIILVDDIDAFDPQVFEITGTTPFDSVFISENDINIKNVVAQPSYNKRYEGVFGNIGYVKNLNISDNNIKIEKINTFDNEIVGLFSKIGNIENEIILNNNNIHINHVFNSIKEFGGLSYWFDEYYAKVYITNNDIDIISIGNGIYDVFGGLFGYADFNELILSSNTFNLSGNFFGKELGGLFGDFNSKKTLINSNIISGFNLNSSEAGGGIIGRGITNDNFDISCNTLGGNINSNTGFSSAILGVYYAFSPIKTKGNLFTGILSGTEYLDTSKLYWTDPNLGVCCPDGQYLCDGVCIAEDQPCESLIDVSCGTSARETTTKPTSDFCVLPATNGEVSEIPEGWSWACSFEDSTKQCLALCPTGTHTCNGECILDTQECLINSDICGTSAQETTSKPTSDFCYFDEFLDDDGLENVYNNDISELNDDTWKWSCTFKDLINTYEYVDYCYASCPAGYVISGDICIESLICGTSAKETETKPTSNLCSNGSHSPVQKSDNDTWNWTCSSVDSSIDCYASCPAGKYICNDDCINNNLPCDGVCPIGSELIEGECVNQGPQATISFWKLSPDLVSEGKKCGAEWNITAVEGVSCKITNESGTKVTNITINTTDSITSSASGNNIDPKYSYKIVCSNAEGNMVAESSLKSCKLNPAYRE